MKIYDRAFAEAGILLAAYCRIRDDYCASYNIKTDGTVPPQFTEKIQHLTDILTDGELDEGENRMLRGKISAMCRFLSSGDNPLINVNQTQSVPLCKDETEIWNSISVAILNRGEAGSSFNYPFPDNQYYSIGEGQPKFKKNVFDFEDRTALSRFENDPYCKMIRSELGLSESFQEYLVHDFGSKYNIKNAGDNILFAWTIFSLYLREAWACAYPLVPSGNKENSIGVVICSQDLCSESTTL